MPNESHQTLVTIIAGYAVSGLLSFILPEAVAYGVGFSGVIILAYYGMGKPGADFRRWLLLSALVGALFFAVKLLPRP